MSNNSNSKHKSEFLRILLILALAIIVGFFGSVGYQIYKALNSENDNEHISAVQLPVIDELEDSYAIDTGSPSSVEKSSSGNHSVSTADYSDLVECVMPSIVGIECTTTYTYYGFFGSEESYDSLSSGSGFFVSQSPDKLFITTNNHVVADATSVSVNLPDATKVDAEIVGTDSYYDLAVISINISDISSETLKNIRIATLGNSDKVSVGDISIAIGNALGYGQSTTVGYISALDRELYVSNIKKFLIQTDAAINPGNSGGPLLNIYGQVIGINSVKYASEEVEGMGYAIPISEAIPIINELIDAVTLDEADIGYLGIQGTDITQSYSSGFGMPVGIYVYSIDPGSPADRSELCEGDIITEINGRKVSSMEDLKNRLNYIRAGETVVLTVNTLTEGHYREHTIDVVLGKRPQE